MTTQKAIKFAEEQLEISTGKQAEFLTTVIKELNYRIPKHKVMLADECYGFCDCGAMVCEGANYCNGCGQRLKWGKSNVQLYF